MEINKTSQKSFMGKSDLKSEIIIKDKNILDNNKENVINSTEEEVYSERELKEAAEIVNSLLKRHESHVEYTMHEKFKNVIMIKIVDSKTGDILSEIPPKKIMDMVAKMCEMVGIMVDKKA